MTRGYRSLAAKAISTLGEALDRHQQDLERAHDLLRELSRRCANAEAHVFFLKGMMRDVIVAWGQRESVDDEPASENAPGHGHPTPGVWDQDTGPLAGKACRWCRLWEEFKKEAYGR